MGDYVTINGVRKGNVHDIEIQKNSVLVTVSLDYDEDLRQDAVFAVSMVDMMGGKKIDINPGTSSIPLDFNKVQNGVFYADIPSVMSFIGSMQNELTSTLQDVKVSLNSLNNYLTDQKLNENIKKSVENLSQLTGKLVAMVDENRASIKKLSSNSVDLTNDAKDFMNKNKVNISNSISEAESVLKNTDSLVASLNSITSDIKSKNNNIGKLFYDQSIYDNLNQSIKQVNELTKLLLDQLKQEGIKIDAKFHLF